jgi:hypothetical protein
MNRMGADYAGSAVEFNQTYPGSNFAETPVLNQWMP